MAMSCVGKLGWNKNVYGKFKKFDSEEQRQQYMEEKYLHAEEKEPQEKKFEKFEDMEERQTKWIRKQECR